MYQNLEDFLSTLSPQEKEFFFKLSLEAIINEKRTVLKRTSLKLSADLSEMEIRLAISETIKVPLEQIHIDFEKEKSKMRNQLNKVETIIKEYKAKLDNSKNITPDKYEELYDIGKFILAIDKKCKIDVPDEILKFPDFVIAFEGKKIGLEHTRLMNEMNKAVFKTAKYCIQKAQEIIASELSYLSKTVNIFIDYDKNIINESNFRNGKFNRIEKKEIIQTISDFVRSELTGGNLSKPDYIIQIKITPNKDSRVDLELGESYFTISQFEDMLLKCIEKKEAKADNYRMQIGKNEIWLLVVIDDINSFSGFDLKTATFPQIRESNFDSILLFEKFGATIYTLFPPATNHSI